MQDQRGLSQRSEISSALSDSFRKYDKNISDKNVETSINNEAKHLDPDGDETSTSKRQAT
jgi:hypothetical protein